MNADSSNPTAYEELQARLVNEPHTWLVTGVAGFIGSNLLETLLKLDQRVVGLDNFSTGYQHNLDEIRASVSAAQWEKFSFIQGDIRSSHDCHRACEGVEYVLHQAALGSVPRSLADPIATNEVNVSGFLNMLEAARQVGVKSFTYAASSSTYGDHPTLPKIEETIGNPLSPYAITKYVNELYGQVFARCYGFNSVGLRYFNVFGKRQDPSGAYAAVIPKWIAAMARNEEIQINGDGDTSRDFCFVENAIQANLLAATSVDSFSGSRIYNVAFGGRTTLNDLFDIIKGGMLARGATYDKSPKYKEHRVGDVKHSQACIDKAKDGLGYAPQYDVRRGIEKTISWFIGS